MPGLLSDSDAEALLSSLMRRSQAGDREAYRTLLERVRSLVQNYVNQQVRRSPHADENLAADVVQEILLGIHSKLHTYDPAQYFLPWMYAVARYKLIDHLRALKRRKPEMTVELEDVENELFTDPASESDAEMPPFEELIAKLPGKQQLLLRLVKLRGLSVREAAVESGLSESDVKVSVHRAVKTLRTQWRNDDET